MFAVAVTAVSAALITVETARRRLREREARDRRQQCQLPVQVAPGPDFYLESFNDTWALEFLRYSPASDWGADATVDRGGWWAG